MKLRFSLFSALLFLTHFLSAQLDFYGYLNSNYAGISGVNLNPASIADNRMKVDVALAGFGFSASNNYIGMRKEVLKHHPDYGIIGAYRQLIKQDSTKPVAFPYFEDSLFQDKYLIERTNSDRKSVFFNSNIVLPSFMFSIGPVSTFGFNWRIRNYVNVDGIEPNLAHQIYKELKDSAQWNTQLQNERVSIQYMSWAEYGFTYARILQDDDQNF